jgi:hypothetical protein
MVMVFFSIVLNEIELIGSFNSDYPKPGPSPPGKPSPPRPNQPKPQSDEVKDMKFNKFLS